MLHTLARLLGRRTELLDIDIAPFRLDGVMRWPNGEVWIPEPQPYQVNGLFGRARRGDWHDHALAAGAQVRALALLNSNLERKLGLALTAALITHEQAEAWAGRSLTDDDLERLDECIPFSSIPDAISAIVDSWDD